MRSLLAMVINHATVKYPCVLLSLYSIVCLLQGILQLLSWIRYRMIKFIYNYHTYILLQRVAALKLEFGDNLVCLILDASITIFFKCILLTQKSEGISKAIAVLHLETLHQNATGHLPPALHACMT